MIEALEVQEKPHRFNILIGVGTVKALGGRMYILLCHSPIIQLLYVQHSQLRSRICACKLYHGNGQKIRCPKDPCKTVQWSSTCPQISSAYEENLQQWIGDDWLISDNEQELEIP